MAGNFRNIRYFLQRFCSINSNKINALLDTRRRLAVQHAGCRQIPEKSPRDGRFLFQA
jgi:hypothetical protein